jgi:hypothetical protein
MGDELYIKFEPSVKSVFIGVAVGVHKEMLMKVATKFVTKVGITNLKNYSPDFNTSLSC